jgi:sulfatase maturation enzyme AslB (radical SAM superfamily)
MTFNTAKVFIDKLLNNEFEILNLDKIFAISVEFIGGEPLMEIELIEEIWEYFMTQMILLEHPWVYNIRMSICSNGILYETPKVQKFFNKYHNFISFSVSIDGNKELHDSCRVDLNGNGSYDTVVSTVKSY